MFQSEPSRAFTERIPESFCSCKSLAILYIGWYSTVCRGRQGVATSQPEVDPYSPESVFVKKNAFRIYRTDATRLAGTADDAAL
jgi:hypothetical protein